MRIKDVLDRLAVGFNDNNLDQVMDCFAEHAVYRPGDGSEHRGKPAIRAAFQPQFNGVYGRMRFVVDDTIIDEGARKATLRWVCQHDTTQAPAPRRWLLGLLYGQRCGWYGTDIFHFDDAGLVIGKFTYGNYNGRPQIRRDLGSQATPQ